MVFKSFSINRQYDQETGQAVAHLVVAVSYKL